MQRGVFEKGARAGVKAAAPSQRIIVATHPISERREAYSKQNGQLERKVVKKAHVVRVGRTHSTRRRDSLAISSLGVASARDPDCLDRWDYDKATARDQGG